MPRPSDLCSRQQAEVDKIITKNAIKIKNKTGYVHSHRSDRLERSMMSFVQLSDTRQTAGRRGRPGSGGFVAAWWASSHTAPPILG